MERWSLPLLLVMSGIVSAGCEESVCTRSEAPAFGVEVRAEFACTLPDDITVEICADVQCSVITLDALREPGGWGCSLLGGCDTPDEYGEYLGCSWGEGALEGTSGTVHASASGYAPAHADLTATWLDDGCHLAYQHAVVELEPE